MLRIIRCKKNKYPRLCVCFYTRSLFSEQRKATDPTLSRKLRAQLSKYLMIPLIKSRNQPPSLPIKSLMPLPHGTRRGCLPLRRTPASACLLLHLRLSICISFLFPFLLESDFLHNSVFSQGLINVPERQEPFCIPCRGFVRKEVVNIPAALILQI